MGGIVKCHRHATVRKASGLCSLSLGDGYRLLTNTFEITGHQQNHRIAAADISDGLGESALTSGHSRFFGDQIIFRCAVLHRVEGEGATVHREFLFPFLPYHDHLAIAAIRSSYSVR